MPDVRILAPPVAKISYSKKQEFSEEYFHILVSGVILRSLGRIETGLDSNLKGSLGTPPLKQEFIHQQIPRYMYIHIYIFREGVKSQQV